MTSFVHASTINRRFSRKPSLLRDAYAAIHSLLLLTVFAILQDWLDDTESRVGKRFRRKSIGSKAIQAIALIPFRQTNYASVANTAIPP